MQHKQQPEAGPSSPRLRDDGVSGSNSEYESGAEEEDERFDGLGEGMDPEGFAGEKVVKPLTAEALAAFKAAQDRAGVVYISRIPPGMRPAKVRHLMSGYGEVGRVYLQQEDAKRAYLRKKYTSTKKAHFTEGWVEFKDKKVARSVAEMLNAQPIGGKKGSRWRDDIWTMKYLPRFKWNMLTEQVAHEAAVQSAKLRVELSQSRQEQQDYLRNVELARVLDKRAEKKREKGETMELKRIRSPSPHRPEKRKKAKVELESSRAPYTSRDHGDSYRMDWEHDRDRAYPYERDRPNYDYRRGRSRSPPPDENRKRRRSMSPYERDRYEPRPRHNDDYDTHSRGYGGYSPRRSHVPPPYPPSRRPPPDPHTFDYPATLKQYAEWFRYFYPQQATEEDSADKAAEQEAADGSKPRNGIKSRWEKYKKEFAANQLQLMFDHHKKSPWFSEKYDPSPECQGLRTRVRKEGWKGRLQMFLLDLESGKFDPDLNEQQQQPSKDPSQQQQNLNGDSSSSTDANGNGNAVPSGGDDKPGAGDDDMQFNIEADEEPADDSRPETNGKGQSGGRKQQQSSGDNRGEEISVPTEGNQVMIRTIPPDIGRVKLEELCAKIPKFVYLALGDPLQKRNFYRAGWIRFRDDADMPAVLNDLSEKKIEGFKLHVTHMVKPFVNRIRYTPEVASRPERLEKDLGNAKKLAAILEDEAARLRTAQVQPAGSSTSTTTAATSAAGTTTGEEDPQGDANMASSAVEPPAAAAIEEDEPEPKENGSEAVERRIEKVMSELREQGLVDVNNEKEYEERKTVVALDLYLAYLRAAFNTCYYCSVTTDHVEELQRKCIQHIRKPMPKPVAATTASEEQKPEVKMDTEPSAKEEAKEDGGEKQADAQKEKEKEKKDNASKTGKERHNDRWLEWLDSKIALLISRDEVDPRDYGGKSYEEELTKVVEPHIKQEDEGKFRCKTCQKLFKATSFVEKHISNKHPELVKPLDEVPYFNNFALDPHRIQPFAHPPPNSGNTNSQPPPQAFGIQGPPSYPGGDPRGFYPPYGSYPPPPYHNGHWDYPPYMHIPPMYLAANSMPPMPRDDRGGGRRLSDRLGGFAEGGALPSAAGLPAKPLPAALDQPLSAGGGGAGERGLSGRRNGGGRTGGAGGPPPPPPPDAKEDPRAAAGRRVSYHDMDLVAEGDVELSY
ncbi:hypothetical protein MD484_g2187, partial [Candolleomyces efflorescens]